MPEEKKVITDTSLDFLDNKDIRKKKTAFSYMEGEDIGKGGLEENTTAPSLFDGEIINTQSAIPDPSPRPVTVQPKEEVTTSYDTLISAPTPVRKPLTTTTSTDIGAVRVKKKVQKIKTNVEQVKRAIKPSKKLEARLISAPESINTDEEFQLEYEVDNKTFRAFPPLFATLFESNRRLRTRMAIFSFFKKTVKIIFKLKEREGGVKTYVAQFGFNPLFVLDEVKTEIQVIQVEPEQENIEESTGVDNSAV